MPYQLVDWALAVVTAAEAQCELVLTAPSRNSLTYLLTYLQFNSIVTWQHGTITKNEKMVLCLKIIISCVNSSKCKNKKNCS